ncbi:MAG: MFS transporter [Clostridia bacterium]
MFHAKRGPILTALGGFGLWMIALVATYVVLEIVVFRMSHSALAVGVLFVLRRVAAMVTASPSGSFVDRHPKAPLLAGVCLVAAACVAVPLGMLTLWVAYALIFAVAILETLYRAAFTPYWREVVAPEDRPRANAMREFLQGAALLLGPAAVAASYLRAGASGAFGMALGLFVAAALVVATQIRGEAVLSPPSGSRERMTFRGDLARVGAFFRAEPLITRVLLLYNLAIVVSNAVDAQAVVFAIRALRLAPAGFALLTAMGGLGGLVGSAVLVGVGGRFPPRWALLLGAPVAASGFLLYAVAPGFAVAAAGLVLLGAAQGAANVGYATFIQTVIPRDQMARILSSVRSIFAGLTLVLAVAATGAVPIVGIRAVTVVGAAAMVLAAGFLGRQVARGPATHFATTSPAPAHRGS